MSNSYRIFEPTDRSSEVNSDSLLKGLRHRLTPIDGLRVVNYQNMLRITRKERTDEIFKF